MSRAADSHGRAVPARETVLIVDDGELSAARMKAELKDDSRQVLVTHSAREALSLLPDLAPDLIVASLDLPDLPGLRLLDVLRERAPGVPVVAVVANPDMDLAVQAVRRGALDVLAHPIHRVRLAEAVHGALSEVRGNRELARAREQVRDRQGFGHMLTQSPRMLRVFDQIRAVASTDATVLIRGETGTGKELVSRAIHERSRRRDKPFISVNCGAFTESLLESELFGHEKGSFTGAGGRRRGVFEMADGGTLFLDELGETTLNVQVNLLRVLEEMRFRRVGGHELVKVDVRIIAATNVDLEAAVAEGRFRQDLFYRLNVFPLFLPPLRERPEDIPLLTRHFLEDAASEYGLEPPTLAPDAMQAILRYRWPGNVRQLRSLCERWVIVAAGRQITLDMLPPDMVGSRVVDGPTLLPVDDSLPLKAATERAVAQVERTYLQRLLERNRGHLGRTAQAAGITRRTLYTKMKLYGLDAADYRTR
ncbi:MAG: sigma-54-dependent Fis family transcriptional regulator [Deltaproteobacteria bacterium]|nr:MAG: sigma-54-dependent Fis family transcriptional regulator [Deltaproteobacteria bacterium]